MGRGKKESADERQGSGGARLQTFTLKKLCRTRGVRPKSLSLYAESNNTEKYNQIWKEPGGGLAKTTR